MTWATPVPCGDQPAARGGHTATALGHKCYFFGGANRSPEAFNDVWCLDTADDRFEWTLFRTNSEKLGLAGRSGSSVTPIAGRLYVFGGQEPQTGACFNDVLVFDPERKAWWRPKTTNGAPPPRHSHCACAFHGTRLLIWGGASESGLADSHVYIFDTEKFEWSKPAVAGTPPAAREMAAAAHVEGKGFFIHGGRSSSGIVNDIVILDTEELIWREARPTKYGRCAHTAVIDAIGQRVLLFGGFTGSGLTGELLELLPGTLDIRVLQGDAAQPAPTARFAHAAAAVESSGENKIYRMIVFGGVTPERDLEDIMVWEDRIVPVADLD